MNDTTLLEYGQRELPAFRADMRAIAGIDGGSRRYVAARLRDVLRNADARREEAGLTRTEAEIACVLAAAKERSAR